MLVQGRIDVPDDLFQREPAVIQGPEKEFVER
jgi:hypothetical protein